MCIRKLFLPLLFRRAHGIKRMDGLCSSVAAYLTGKPGSDMFVYDGGGADKAAWMRRFLVSRGRPVPNPLQLLHS